MKKFFVALSVLAALFLTVVPSQANSGMPDRVPANMFTIPVVCAIDESLDTLVAIHEVLGNGTVGGANPVTYRLHWRLMTRKSVEIINDYIPYTPYDVTTIAVGRQIIWKDLSATDLAGIAADLDNDGTNDHYVCYLEIEDTIVGGASLLNHLVGNFYFVDPSGGKAAGENAAGWEYLVGQGYHPYQKMAPWVGSAAAYTTGQTSASRFEGWSALAYATSRLREEGFTAADAVATGVNSVTFNFVPRWWLYTVNGENNIFIWKSRNTTQVYGGSDPGTVGGWTGVTISVYDNNEDYVSRSINLPEELNILDVKEIIPQSWIPTGTTDADQLGGWLNIPMPTGRYAEAVDLVAWNWQRSQSANAALNWSSLYEVHRLVGTWMPTQP